MKSFKHHTATSHDALKPHLLAQLSNEAIEHLLLLYDRCEDEGRWPDQWRHPALVCIPKKKEGGFRLIALLHFAYRAWAKNAARGVSAWMAQLGKDWLAFGPGCAAEDAAYDVLLANEAADEDEYYTVMMISDLEKGFEKVTWEKGIRGRARRARGVRGRGAGVCREVEPRERGRAGVGTRVGGGHGAQTTLFTRE